MSELRALSAFTADLEVCEETGQEWAMVAAVPELLTHLKSPEPVVVPENSPLPPPPPQGPPNRAVLQGELFLEPNGQQHLIGINGNPPYYFHPSDENPELPSTGYLPVQTSPFRFFAPSLPTSLAMAPMPLVELPKPVVPPIPPTPIEPHVIEESELGVLEPEALPESHETVEPKTELPLPTTVEKPVVESPRYGKPRIEMPQFPIPLQISAPKVEPKVEAPPPVPIQPRLHPSPLPDFAKLSLPEILDLEPRPRKSRAWIWILFGSVAIAMLGAFVFTNRLHRAVEIMPPPPLPEPERMSEPPAIVEEPPIEVVKPPKIERKKPKKPKAIKRAPKPEPIAEAAPVSEPVPEPEPAAVPVTSIPGMSAATENAAPDLWKGKEQEAIERVLKCKIFSGKSTIGETAKLTLLGMHDKELLHAADTGERLYLPDKLSWSALREEGSRYRVYLNFMAWQLNGERVQPRTDAFSVDLQRNGVTPADDSTQKNFFDPAGLIQHQPNTKADDIESVLSAVDTLNRHKLRSVILKSGKLKKDEQKSFQAAIDAAEKKFIKTIVYFRTKYAEKTLQNVAKAYGFTAVLKGK